MISITSVIDNHWLELCKNAGRVNGTERKRTKTLRICAGMNDDRLLVHVYPVGMLNGSS
ncbi:hypothetical protein LINGRAHAP2_LOCUS36222 [Linum grandiflorum]